MIKVLHLPFNCQFSDYPSATLTHYIYNENLYPFHAPVFSAICERTGNPD